MAGNTGSYALKKDGLPASHLRGWLSFAFILEDQEFILSAIHRMKNFLKLIGMSWRPIAIGGILERSLEETEQAH